ncbi:MAG TPA: RimK/LysX family protein [Candidatus Saccharimonadales bacterium]|nr:RimK/LysX family protein [Candidatus Saccharimonadales bacterium]
MNAEDKKIVGRAEKIAFPELGFKGVPARIDTGAKTSAIWADATQTGDTLTITFFGKTSPLYTGEAVKVREFETVTVTSSTGQVQERYKIRLLVKIKGRKIRAWFTLADRSTQVYPVLVGRNLLRGKFIVDVQKGHELSEQEHPRVENSQTHNDGFKEDEA